MPNVHTIYDSGFGHTRLQADAVRREATGVAGTVATLWSVEEATSRFRLDPGTAPIAGDLATAEAYGRRVAEITAIFLRGKQG
jgi:hypothetical protein